MRSPSTRKKKEKHFETVTKNVLRRKIVVDTVGCIKSILLSSFKYLTVNFCEYSATRRATQDKRKGHTLSKTVFGQRLWVYRACSMIELCFHVSGRF